MGQRTKATRTEPRDKSAFQRACLALEAALAGRMLEDGARARRVEGLALNPGREDAPALVRGVRFMGLGREGPSAADCVRQGDAQREQRRWRKAASFYAEALRLKPEMTHIWVQLGHAHKESGQMIGAEAAYLRALSADPMNWDTHLQMGHLLKITGRRDQAALAYLRALDLEETAEDPLSELVHMLAQDQVEVTAALAGALEAFPRASERIHLHVQDSLHRIAERPLLGRGAGGTLTQRRQFVRDAFLGVLGRHADDEALAFYADALAAGMARVDLLRELVHAPELGATANAQLKDALNELALEVEARLALKSGLPIMRTDSEVAEASPHALAHSLHGALVTLLDS
ncbi:DUF4214 domain-containing protein [Aquabacter sp. L1I39]|uniref:tetratricopeptide repeat protein n=1 Tax=Aquabacter sp. L1I39 TaxID=2820278 RepID=UPI001ADC516E|nr:DUF4214 domain-containing protein [Aquabacter sp. L1I39]QTL04632.1 DUF4214 domain-containing protein [Aquabacter sp. L1I39]